MKRFFGHIKTVCSHRHMVLRHCIKAGIFWQGLTHDLSKFSPTEFWVSVKNYQGYRSPCAKEREEKGHSLAWMHHKGRNKHHFEYWTDFSAKEHRTVPVEMPPKYLAEMFCDRLAASKVYKGESYTDTSAKEYFLSEKPTIMMHPKTMEALEGLFAILEKDGEEAAFEAIRRMLKK